MTFTKNYFIDYSILINNIQIYFISMLATPFFIIKQLALLIFVHLISFKLYLLYITKPNSIFTLLCLSLTYVILYLKYIIWLFKLAQSFL